MLSHSGGSPFLNDSHVWSQYFWYVENCPNVISFSGIFRKVERVVFIEDEFDRGLAFSAARITASCFEFWTDIASFRRNSRNFTHTQQECRSIRRLSHNSNSVELEDEAQLGAKAIKSLNPRDSLAKFGVIETGLSAAVARQPTKKPTEKLGDNARSAQRPSSALAQLILNRIVFSQRCGGRFRARLARNGDPGGGTPNPQE
jgi:hypothetical protein